MNLCQRKSLSVDVALPFMVDQLTPFHAAIIYSNSLVREAGDDYNDDDYNHDDDEDNHDDEDNDADDDNADGDNDNTDHSDDQFKALSYIAIMKI